MAQDTEADHLETLARMAGDLEREPMYLNESCRAAVLWAVETINAQDRFIAFMQDALKREMEDHEATHTTMRTAVEALLTRKEGQDGLLSRCAL